MIETEAASPEELDPRTRAFYGHAFTALVQAKVPFLVGGAYAFGRYTGIVRHTKDFDIFVRPRDRDRALAALAATGYHTEVCFPHWLAKGFCGDDFVDVIYSSGNGLATVDDAWFEHAVEGELFGLPVRLCPVEEIIWQKAFVMERERYDGADVAHLLRATAEGLNWDRLLRRFGSHWRVLLSHLVLFGFIYPGERLKVPAPVMRELLGRLQTELTTAAPVDSPCQGTLISRAQYLTDVEQWGYPDPRLTPLGNLSEVDLALWNADIPNDQIEVAGADERH